MTEETNVQGTENTAQEQEKTFTQADVDKMIQSRLDRERKKYPSEEEITAYRTWKDSQQTEQERQAERDKEFADNKSALTAAQAEVQQLKREKYVLSKGLTGEEAGSARHEGVIATAPAGVACLMVSLCLRLLLRPDAGDSALFHADLSVPELERFEF